MPMRAPLAQSPGQLHGSIEILEESTPFFVFDGND
jgi:hypothetical protein